jgi:hypothetical protein
MYDKAGEVPFGYHVNQDISYVYVERISCR